MENVNWDEIKENIRKTVQLQKIPDSFSIKISILQPHLEKNQLLGSMLKNELELKQSISTVVNEGKPIDCEIEVNYEQNFIFLTFKEKDLWEKTYNFFNELFFGDYLKKMMDAMMGAFGGMFGKDL